MGRPRRSPWSEPAFVRADRSNGPVDGGILTGAGDSVIVSSNGLLVGTMDSDHTDPPDTASPIVVATASAALARAQQVQESYARAARSQATRSAYQGDWERFQAWATGLHLPSLPSSPEVVSMYLGHLADEGCRVSTIDRALAAIGFFHVEAQYDWVRGHPKIRETRKGIRNRIGVAQDKKAGFTDDLLVSAMELLAPEWRGIMQRAMLTAGFFGGLRRSEIVSIERAHVSFQDSPRAVLVWLPRRKTDQEGEGTTVGMAAQEKLSVCPVIAMRAWLDVLYGDRVFPVSGRYVGRLVKMLAGRLGLDASKFGGHSLRAGLITTMDRNGVPSEAGMRQSGHKSHKIYMGYVRHARVMTNNPTIGLVRS